MPNTLKYRKEHSELNSLINDIDPFLYASAVTVDPLKARALLHELTELALAHMGREDEELYPKFFVHDDEAIRIKSHEVFSEAETLALILATHKKKWQSEALIEMRSGDFARETTKVVDALSALIRKENNMLFPLVDG